MAQKKWIFKFILVGPLVLFSCVHNENKFDNIKDSGAATMGTAANFNKKQTEIIKKTPKEIRTENKIYGVTLDSIENITEAVEALKKLRVKPTVRVVFDEKVAPEQYVEALRKLHDVSFIMGELVDSYYMKNYSRAEHKEHTARYLRTLGDIVDIWEFGNEVNGEWVGPTKDVIAKLDDSFSQIKKLKKPTALTLYYNEGCFEKPESEIFHWTKQNVSEDIRQQVDYVFISYYEDDCDGPQPDWKKVFVKLSDLFPNSKLGFGEVGSKFPEKKSAYIKKYYNIKINEPRFVGGFFWWYFSQDMVPSSKPLWKTLNSSLVE